MAGTYELRWRNHETWLHFALHGRWDLRTMIAFDRDLRAALEHARGHGFRVLVDLTDFPRQAAAVRMGHEALMRIPAGPLRYVTSPAEAEAALAA